MWRHPSVPRAQLGRQTFTKSSSLLVLCDWQSPVYVFEVLHRKAFEREDRAPCEGTLVIGTDASADVMIGVCRRAEHALQEKHLRCWLAQPHHDIQHSPIIYLPRLCDLAHSLVCAATSNKIQLVGQTHHTPLVRFSASRMSGIELQTAGHLRSRQPIPAPVPAYLPTAGSPLTVDTALYSLIQQAPRLLTDDFTLPARSGRAWKAPAGSIIRISTPEGPQVGDLNIWNADNPRERFWASRTRQLHAAHVSTYDRLWSCLPYMRPLVTVISDTLAWYGKDEHGGRVHDLLGTRCDPYINTVLSGEQYDFHCHSNLTRAVLPFGLAESDIHDVLNLFQVTGLDAEGRYFMNPCPAERGDHIEFLAEQDVLMALSKSLHFTTISTRNHGRPCQV